MERPGQEVVGMEPPELRLMADYGADPLWAHGVMVRIGDLGLSPRLAAELRRWAEDFERTTPRGRRMKPGDFLPEDWVARGRRLATQLQLEVREEFRVTYDP